MNLDEHIGMTINVLIQEKLRTLESLSDVLNLTTHHFLLLLCSVLKTLLTLLLKIKVSLFGLNSPTLAQSRKYGDSSSSHSFVSSALIRSSVRDLGRFS